MDRYDYKLAANMLFVIGAVGCIVMVCITMVTIAAMYAP